MTKVFDDFSGGWRGTLDLAKIPDNMYDARNLIVYRDGSIGPRPGAKAFDLGRTPAGEVHGADTRRDITDPQQVVLLYVDGTTLWAVDADNSGTDSNDFFNIVSEPVPGWPVTMYHRTNYRTFIDVPGDGLYKFQQGAITALRMGDDAGTSTPHGVRILTAERNTLRIYYSEPLDDTDWPALNYIDVGDDPGAGIVWLAQQNNHVVAVTEYGAWYVLTGVPGVNDTLRQIYQDLVFPAPISVGAFVSLSNNELWCLSPANNFPVRFDGSKLEQMPYLSMTPEDSHASYAADLDVAHVSAKALLGATSDSPCFILPDPTNRMLLRHNGAWGLHDLGVDSKHAWATSGRGRMYGFLADNSAAFTMDFALNRPAFTDDTHARPGDLTDTPLDNELVLAEQWSEDGDHLQVSEVVVDIRAWNTGVANNSFSVKVDALARGSEVPTASLTKTWTQPASGFTDTDAGTEDRIRFQFGSQGQGAGYRVTISDLVGVAIRQIVVRDEPKPSDGRVY